MRGSEATTGEGRRPSIGSPLKGEGRKRGVERGREREGGEEKERRA